MLTAKEKAQFELHGFLRLENAISAPEIRGLSEAAWAKLEQHGILRESPVTWNRPRPRGIQSVATTKEFDAMASRRVRDALDVLFGHRDWQKPTHWGQLLVTLPTNGEWEVPRAAWHIDLPPTVISEGIPGVQIFVCLEDIVPRGGATVAVAGSHILVRNFLQEAGYPRKRASATIRDALANRHLWLSQLWSHAQGIDRAQYFMAYSTDVEGCDLQVVEFTGSAGDVIFMHPYVFHAPSTNSRRRPRLALTQRLAAG